MKPSTAVTPIPTSARIAIEFTPAHQDADGYERRENAALAQRERELDSKRRRAREGLVDAAPTPQPAARELNDEYQQIETQRRVIQQTVAQIRAQYAVPQVFVLSTPTSLDRDRIQSRLISLGLRQVSQEMIRATMIEELFTIDWEKGSPEENEAYAEEQANLLDDVWQRQETHDAAIARWQEQETQRVLDEADGAPARPRAPMPPKIITVRENARATNLIEIMMSRSQRLRDMAAEATDFNRQNGMMIVRLHLIAVANVDVQLVIEMRTNAATDESIRAVRENVDDMTWQSLVAKIDSMYRLDGGEIKNSDSPLGNSSDLSGSIARNDDTRISGGSSMSSSTAAAPADGSEMTTERLSGSTTGSSETPEKTEQPSTQTAAA